MRRSTARPPAEESTPARGSWPALGVDLGAHPVADRVEVVLGLVEEGGRRAVGDARRLLGSRRRHQRALGPRHGGQPTLVLGAVRPGSATGRQGRGRGRTCGRHRRWRRSGSRSACTPGASASATSVRTRTIPGSCRRGRFTPSCRVPTWVQKWARAQSASVSSGSDSHGKASRMAPASSRSSRWRRGRRPAGARTAVGGVGEERSTTGVEGQAGPVGGDVRGSESIQTCWSPYLDRFRKARPLSLTWVAMNDRVTLLTIAEALGDLAHHRVERLQPARPAQPGAARGDPRQGPGAGLRRPRPPRPAALRHGTGRGDRADREVAAGGADRSGVAADARRRRRGVRRGRGGAGADPSAHRRRPRPRHRALGGRRRVRRPLRRPRRRAAHDRRGAAPADRRARRPSGAGRSERSTSTRRAAPTPPPTTCCRSATGASPSCGSSR